MLRIVIAVLMLTISMLGGAFAQEAPIHPSFEQRVQALHAFEEGDVALWGEYLKKSLVWYEYMFEQGNSSLDQLKVRNGIIENAKKQGVRLTDADLADKIDAAKLLFQNNDRGKMRLYREKIADLCRNLGRYYEVISDTTLALKYREKAAKFD